MVAKGSLNKTTLKMRELAGQHAPAAVRVLVELMQHANEGTQLNAACTILDHAYGRPRICTERTITTTFCSRTCLKTARTKRTRPGLNR
jgi:hypothetical protein